MKRTEVWKIKDQVCTACGEELDEETFELYHREDTDEVEADGVDMMCPSCHERITDNDADRGETEDLLEEIEEEMPDASRERKTLEYLRRFSGN